MHALLSIESFDELYGHLVIGASWEGLVIESIVPRLKPSIKVSYYRSASGDEIDLVLEKAGRTIAIECKVSKSPELSKGNNRAREVVSPAMAYVVAPVDEPYSLSGNWTVVNISHLIKCLSDAGWLRY